MSHIAGLVRADQFRTAPPKSLNFLKKHPALSGSAAGLALVLAAFAHSAGGSPATVTAPPPPAVTVAAVAPQTVRIWSEFSGRLAPVNAADIRPEVSGRVTEVRFKNGQQVQAGDILFVIDPRPYEAAVAKAQADLATAQHNASLANVEYSRAQRLVAEQAVARDYYDQRENAHGVAAANVQSAEAAVTQAKLDVDHAYVKAPISGRVSRAEITVGNLVQTGPNAPLLTSIVSDDGIYADFDVDEQTYLNSIRSHATSLGQEQHIPVELRLTGDAGHVYQGMIESFDNKISTGTGTIRARAHFANSDGTLVPGMFVTVRMADAASSRAILVPEDAASSDQSKRFVYVVDQGHKAEFREVTLGQEVDGRRVVLSGLKTGEHIIVGGVQRVQPGAVVDDRINVAAR
ncbi:MAG TPA: efflux RND transporter periplasmic adaptor subunit [Rhizomicrobium sp.]|jgi:multidrug efflux system membrane fusion protein